MQFGSPAILLCLCFGLTLAKELELTRVDQMVDADMADLDREEKLTILGTDGRLLSSVDVMFEEGYQLELPEDRAVCLHRPADDNQTCYEEGPVTEKLTDAILDRCAGREVVVLTPVSCSANTVQTPVAKSSGSSSKSSWDTCCRWTYTKTRICVCRYCCRRFLGICFRRCCKEWADQVIWTKRCVSGYTSTFSV